ncbi:hypothetical protein EDB92DRAFT_1818303 [Lactarius akahatsu]|uniref:Uncharacterized protein n=1 Tax=Lactarius akahatsu TaxID=416441 RepID=A0AAD4LFG3_9AGAM|nr:hypothetical protein EDB92DRAFT_1818303 [Lactarius akahatsu]
MPLHALGICLCMYAKNGDLSYLRHHVVYAFDSTNAGQPFLSSCNTEDLRLSIRRVLGMWTISWPHSSTLIALGPSASPSLLEKLYTVVGPFSELEDLVLLSQDKNGQMLPSTFRWGSHLRSLHVTGVAFPSLPQLLPSIQIHGIPSFGYFSPEAFANALENMTQLQSLSLHFLSPPSRRDHSGVPPQPGAPCCSPNSLPPKFRGISKYLNSLLAGIDTPCLGDIDITFFNQLTFDTSQLGKFVDRIDIQKLHRQADIITSKRAIFISLTRPGAPTRFGSHVLCEQLDWQLFSRPLSGEDNTDGERWLELIRLFGVDGARTFRVAGDLAPDVDSGPLRTSLREDVVSQITWCRLSGCPISVGYMQLSEPPAYLFRKDALIYTKNISGGDTPTSRHHRSSPSPIRNYPFTPIVSERTDTEPHISWLRIPKIGESQRGDIDGSPLCGRTLAPSLGPALFPEDAWLLLPTSSVFGEGNEDKE